MRPGTVAVSISIIIRTYNEERYLKELLDAINSQVITDSEIETVIVDSGSIDRTLPIAESFNCRITHISKKDFTFGRSLNHGCEIARGEIIVFVSGHCIPVDDGWLSRLIRPLFEADIVFTYGRQIGRDTTKFSEYRVFEKYYPAISQIPQDGFFCNNANAALLRKVWQQYRFDEELTGLEDMHLARRLVEDKKFIAYVADATVYHIHSENWRNIKYRYERESRALQKIMPELQLSIVDMLRYYSAAVLHDCRDAVMNRVLLGELKNILLFRLMQYWGTYKGNHVHRKLSASKKEKYFYPKN